MGKNAYARHLWLLGGYCNAEVESVQQIAIRTAVTSRVTVSKTETVPITQAPRLQVQAGQSKDRRNKSRAVRSYTIGELYTVYHHILTLPTAKAGGFSVR